MQASGVETCTMSGAPHGTSHNVLLVCQLLQSNPNRVDMDRISFVGVLDCY